MGTLDEALVRTEPVTPTRRSSPLDTALHATATHLVLPARIERHSPSLLTGRGDGTMFGVPQQ